MLLESFKDRIYRFRNRKAEAHRFPNITTKLSHRLNVEESIMT